MPIDDFNVSSANSAFCRKQRGNAPRWSKGKSVSRKLDMPHQFAGEMFNTEIPSRKGQEATSTCAKTIVLLAAGRIVEKRLGETCSWE